MEVTFLQFDKRINSTKQPSAAQLATGIKYEAVYLKNLTNIDSPTLYIDGVDSNIYAYNYCYIKEWGRYYFVKTCDLSNDHICKIDLELDDLATYKTQILATSAFVVYSSSNYNKWLRDDRVPMLPRSHYASEFETIESGSGIGWFITGANQTIILSTVSENQGICHWVTTELGLQQLIEGLVTADDNILESLAQQFGDAMGSIIQVMRLPINSQAMPLSSNTYPVYLGNYPVTLGGLEPIEMHKLVNTHMGLDGNCLIPYIRDDFRIMEPYSILRASIPFVGVVDLNLSDFRDYDTEILTDNVYFKVDIDLTTGQVIWTLKAGSSDGKALGSFSGQCGSLVPIASTQIANSASIVGGFLSSVSTFALGTQMGNAPMAMAGAVSSINSVINGFYNANNKTSSVVGSYSGGHSEYANHLFRVMVESFETSIEPSSLTALEGRPCGEVTALTNLTGYCRTQGFSISLAVNKAVVDSINSKMDAGVYIE
jgi:hypothetical protein